MEKGRIYSIPLGCATHSTSVEGLSFVDGSLSATWAMSPWPSISVWAQSFVSFKSWDLGSRFRLRNRLCAHRLPKNLLLTYCGARLAHQAEGAAIVYALIDLSRSIPHEGHAGSLVSTVGVFV